MKGFCEKLPKLELHAHLNGSLSEKTLKELGCLDKSIEEYQQLSKLLNKTEKTLDECFALFNVAQNATNNKFSLYLATQRVIEEFHQENTIYLEIRTTPRSEPEMTKQDYVESVIKAIKDNKLEIIVKLILSINRSHSKEEAEDSLKVIIKMKNKYPDIIKGIDLSGNPNQGEFCVKLFEKARDNGLMTTIHCAEIKNDKEIKEILKFKPDRIGHATFLHPSYGGNKENWDLYCNLNIPTECCLTSNVICGTSKSYQEHHIKEWIDERLSFSINTDDKGVFNTTLSNEFYQVQNHFHLKSMDLWKISLKTIDFAFASDEEKELLRKKLRIWKDRNMFS